VRRILEGKDSADGRAAVPIRREEGPLMSDMSNMEQLLEQMDTELPDEEILYDLADLFKVFSDTTRIKILYALMGKELRVGEIADIVGATQSAVSHQLRTLKQAHLVKFARDGKNVLYSLADDHVITMLAQGITHVCE
jgi:DNA-binding transcriptional ArsR family regulator